MPKKFEGDISNAEMVAEFLKVEKREGGREGERERERQREHSYTYTYMQVGDDLTSFCLFFRTSLYSSSFYLFLPLLSSFFFLLSSFFVVLSAQGAGLAASDEDVMDEL